MNRRVISTFVGKHNGVCNRDWQTNNCPKTSSRSYSKHTSYGCDKYFSMLACETDDLHSLDNPKLTMNIQNHIDMLEDSPLFTPHQYVPCADAHDVTNFLVARGLIETTGVNVLFYVAENGQLIGYELAKVAPVCKAGEMQILRRAVQLNASRLFAARIARGLLEFDESDIRRMSSIFLNGALLELKLSDYVLVGEAGQLSARAGGILPLA
jgi:hypothetical protein